jgi:nicotinate-nucleotide--dimethylbenzimidazole phosphoribosyltransferase
VVGLGILTAEEAVGRGTGVDEAGVALKARVVEQAVQLHRTAEPKEWLRRVGGLEVAAMVGTILEASRNRIPVVVDGFIATAAAVAAIAMDTSAKEVCFFGHCSHEKAHRKVLEYLNAEPLLDLRMRLGEGTGAALAMNLIDASARIMCEMASFEQAGVSRGDTV